MKIVFDFIKCEDKKFGETEYNNLRNEQNMRVEMAFTHGFTVATITLVFFAAIFAFLGDFYDLAFNENSILGKSAAIDCLIIFAIIFFCGLPNFIILPFSYKYHDNIRVITNIGAYCRVFYEYPSLIAEVSEKDKEDGSVYCWETLHLNGVIPHGNWVAREYLLISISAMVLSSIIGVALFACMAFFHCETYFSTAGNICSIVVFLLAFVAMTGVMGLSCKVTAKNTEVKKLLKVYSETYFDEYVKTAVELKIFDNEQAEELRSYFEAKKEKDERVTNKIIELIK